MNLTIKSALVASLLLTASLAYAQEPEAPPSGAEPAPSPEAATEMPALAIESSEPSPNGDLLAGVRVGGFLAFSKLNANARVGVELGWVLPYLERSFALSIEVGYAAPRRQGVQLNDPRVELDGYHWHLTQHELTVMPTIAYRFTKFGALVPYIGIGPRIYMLRSVTTGEVGESKMAETTETSTKLGFGIPIGAQLKLGPGWLTGELLTEYGPLNHAATGKSNTGAESLLIGYRFLF